MPKAVSAIVLEVPLTVSEFVQRWKRNALTERAGSQSHFVDLCEMLGQPHPAAADSTGERFTFDKPVSKVYGGKGFADVWLRDHFAWEYKGKHKDLKAAYRQLNDYREDLGNPPLLVVCDLDHFEVHTNFENTRKRVYAFNLDDLGKNQVTLTCPLPPLDVLRALFDDYNVLRPDRTDARVTQDAAKIFARLAERLEIEKRANTDSPIYTKEQIAHFLMRLLFCLFADSIGLLPNHLFRNLIQSQDRFLPKKFLRKLKLLFAAMSEPDSIFGEHSIKYFNGGLFDSDSVIELDVADLGILYEVSKNYNWAHIAPEIFGTLFERSLNKERRSLIGAHYTSAEDILLLIEPVLMDPLKRRWATIRNSVLVALESERATNSQSVSSDGALSSLVVSTEAQRRGETPVFAPAQSSRSRKSRKSPAGQTSLRTDSRESERILGAWIDELTSVRVLDPACGSGNFLYLALRRMLDLWKEATDFAVEQGISLVLPKMVSPSQLYGIEIEFYAHELASIVVWIGFLQWKYEHAVQDDREPILQKLDNIQHADAILRYDEEGKPYEPEWPKADYIIGNPPFLGGKRLRKEFGDKYIDDLFGLYELRVRPEGDLVVYWFEKARAELEAQRVIQAGLLATQAIRKGASQMTLRKINQKQRIFWAMSNKPWFAEVKKDTGSRVTRKVAAVRIAMVGFGPEHASSLYLDGFPVTEINADLTSGANLTDVSALGENANLSYQGPVKVGSFEIESSVTGKFESAPANPNGHSNRDVIVPWINAKDLTGRPKRMSIIDFGKMTEAEAALYELPFEYLQVHVKPERAKNRRKRRREYWWQHGERNLGMRKSLKGLARYIATPRVAKHRFFTFVDVRTLADSRVVVIARDDAYFLGVLQSKIHETWSIRQAARHGVGNDPTYDLETCFDPFPFPWPPGTEPAEDADSRVKAIADAAHELVRLRDAWLNPPGISEADLKDRTLTNLYNKRPEWLANAHRALDTAVFAAYGWPDTLADQEILGRLLALNHERAASQSKNV